MVSFVPRHRDLKIYLDHEDNLTGINWDDILTEPVDGRTVVRACSGGDAGEHGKAARWRAGPV